MHAYICYEYYFNIVSSEIRKNLITMYIVMKKHKLNAEYYIHIIIPRYTHLSTGVTGIIGKLINMLNRINCLKWELTAFLLCHLQNVLNCLP